jgi:hypothetical protein
MRFLIMKSVSPLSFNLFPTLINLYLMKLPDPLFFRLMSTWRRSDSVFANRYLRKLNNSSTNYKGWRVVFSPTHLQLDKEALEQSGYPSSALSEN